MTAASRTVLVVEDEAEIRDRIQRILDFEGFSTMGAASIREGLRLCMEQQPDVVVSDIMMPQSDGLDLISVLRARKESRLTPVIMLTALAQREWQRRFMELGADDYITKPFTAEELVGAVQTQCRKLDWRDTAAMPSATRVVAYRFADRLFDPVQRTLTLPNGEEETLTVTEARLLLALLDHAQQGLSREDIFEQMGRRYSPPDRTVDVLVGRLRRKLGDDEKNPTLIVTIRSVGYMLDAEAKRVSLE
jgi:two-component system OmpR family response regulator